jgi:hypothetical protein
MLPLAVEWGSDADIVRCLYASKLKKVCVLSFPFPLFSSPLIALLLV